MYAESKNGHGFPITIEIPRAPVTLNRLLRMHWTIRRKESEVWGAELHAWICDRTHCQEKKMLLAKTELMQKMRVEIEVHHSRLFDEDNLWGATKAIRDAMQREKMIYKDDPEFLTGAVTQVKSARREQKTLIRISPCG